MTSRWVISGLFGIPQPIEAKLEKRGHQYIVSAKLGADEKDWTTIERVTAINAKGKPLLFLRQY